MKRKIKLNEDTIRRMVRRSLMEMMSGMDEGGNINFKNGANEDDYNRNHRGSAVHSKPFFMSTLEYDEALDAKDLEEYDEIMKDRYDYLHGEGNNAQVYHPQATPLKGNLKSIVTSEYPDGESPENIELWNGIRQDSYFPKTDLNEGRKRAKRKVKLNENTLRHIIRNALYEMVDREMVRKNLENSDPKRYARMARDLFTDKSHTIHGAKPRYDENGRRYYSIYDMAMGSDTPEEYDRMMNLRDMSLRNSGEMAMSNHPQATPFRGKDNNDLRSLGTQDVVRHAGYIKD